MRLAAIRLCRDEFSSVYTINAVDRLQLIAIHLPVAIAIAVADDALRCDEMQPNVPMSDCSCQNENGMECNEMDGPTNRL